MAKIQKVTATIKKMNDKVTATIKKMNDNAALKWHIDLKEAVTDFIETTAFKVDFVQQILLKGYEGQAWISLGYESWTQCIKETAKEIGYSESWLWKLHQKNLPEKTSLSDEKQGIHCTSTVESDEKTGIIHFDKVGQPVPEGLIVIFDRVETEIMPQVDQVNAVLKAFRNHKNDKLWGSLKINPIEEALLSVRRIILQEIPYAVCPYCSGEFSEDCEACKSKGWINQSQYKVIPKFKK
jgi:hypothetical protein